MKASEEVKAILAEVKQLAARYYRLTGKPLGVTGEIAEYIAADLLNLTLTAARTPGYDAIRKTPAGEQYIQIKGRVAGKNSKSGQRLGRIKIDAKCHFVVLVLLNDELEPTEIWEAPFSAVKARLIEPGSHARNVHGTLNVSDFKRLKGCEKIWPQT